jgi:hypothetical protein
VVFLRLLGSVVRPTAAPRGDDVDPVVLVVVDDRREPGAVDEEPRRTAELL